MSLIIDGVKYSPFLSDNTWTGDNTFADITTNNITAKTQVVTPTIQERPDILTDATDYLIDVFLPDNEYSIEGIYNENDIEFTNAPALTGVIGNTIVFPYSLDGYTLDYKGSGTLTKSGSTLTWSVNGTIWNITLTSSLHIIDVGCLESSGTIVCDRSGNHFHGYFSAGTWGNQAIAYGSLDNRNQSEGFYRI